MWSSAPSLPPPLAVAFPSVAPSPCEPSRTLLSETLGVSIRWPGAWKEDAATLRRVANLIEPTDLTGTRGSYAGWIARHALSAAVQRAEERVLVSLFIFFQKGGSIRELESIAARVLPVEPPGGRAPTLLGSLWSKASPLHGWRSHRRSVLASHPLAELRLKELEDRNLRLSAGEGAPLGHGQKTAYLKDADVSRVVASVENETDFLLDERRARPRYQRAREAIGSVLPDPREPYDLLWAPQIKGALRLLGDDLSVGVASRMQREYGLYPLPRGRFEDRVRERHGLEGVAAFKDPSTQRAVYFKPSARKGAEMFLQSRPPDLPWNLEAADVFFEVLATAVHEDDHHVRLGGRHYAGTRREKFAFELHAHAVEYLWRAQHGDTVLLRGLTAENPLGFALAFLDYFEATY